MEILRLSLNRMMRRNEDINENEITHICGMFAICNSEKFGQYQWFFMKKSEKSSRNPMLHTFTHDTYARTMQYKYVQSIVSQYGVSVGNKQP